METHEPGKGRLYIDSENFEDIIREMAEQPRPPWKPGAYYCTTGDILHEHWSENSYYAKWLNHRITLLLDQETDEVIGCQIWGLSKVLDEANREIRTKHHTSREDEGHTCDRDDSR